MHWRLLSKLVCLATPVCAVCCRCNYVRYCLAAACSLELYRGHCEACIFEFNKLVFMGSSAFCMQGLASACICAPAAGYHRIFLSCIVQCLSGSSGTATKDAGRCHPTACGFDTVRHTSCWAELGRQNGMAFVVTYLCYQWCQHVWSLHVSVGYVSHIFTITQWP